MNQWLVAGVWAGPARAAGGPLMQHRDLVRPMGTEVFGLLAPFYFPKAGMLVSLPAVWSGAELIGAFLAVKVGAKFVGVLPLTHVFRLSPRRGAGASRSASPPPGA